MWYNEFNAVFWSGIATVVMGAVGLAIKYGLKSKCDDVNLCWGLIKIHRRVDLEDDPSSDEEKSTPNTPTGGGKMSLPNIKLNAV
jgi:hypothetical protein